MHYTARFFITVWAFTPIWLRGQETISIPVFNPSFEAVLPYIVNDTADWVDCGFLSEAPLQFQPGVYEVDKEAFEGKNYFSLAVRDNFTWDAVGQRLRAPLKPGRCYRMMIHLAQSPYYTAVSPVFGTRVRYKNPIRLLLWGGKKFCQAGQLLAQTTLVKNKDWEPYELIFTPKVEITHLSFQAYYLNPMVAYNGHLLMDFASPIEVVPCETYPAQSPDVSQIEIKPQSKRDLENFIALYGKTIRFERDQVNLFTGKDASTFEAGAMSESFLSLMGKSIRWLSEYRLEIAVKDKPRRLTNARIAYLKQFFTSNKADSSQLDIYPFEEKRPEKGEDWTSENAFLAIRLRAMR
ncbi:MAG: hypothetical protein HUU01_12100 [Saprospiraceae bacterium]|nr:hypothetical protein [Saprospiraceae bacterium]